MDQELRKRLIIGGVGLTALVTFFGRRQIGAGLMVAWDSAKQQALAAAAGASLGARVVPWVPWIIEAASAEGVSVFALLALGDRESRWGAALTPPGPTGVGDKAPRGDRQPPALGPGGVRGWGYGLMQIDYESFPEFVTSGAYADPRKNIRKGASVLAGKMKYLALTPKTPTVTLTESQASRRGVRPGVYPDPRPLSGDALLRAGLAAYNTGEGNVLKSVAAGMAPDRTTTGADYGTDVIERAQALASRFVAEGGSAQS